MLPTESLGLAGSLRTLYHLKDLKRQGWLRRGVPPHLCESVAGHCYRTAQAGFHYTGDLRTTAMLFIHDWAES
ncbi:TPA: HD domain-containing protein [Candidatus Woesearchaeota archaeon]|nr:HD domain-containing protein [Candidatus Woesearchaeota archaeon]HII88193.1 HD domain-containing protein [Candidatus Woesearchaeota archaeon]